MEAEQATVKAEETVANAVGGAIRQRSSLDQGRGRELLEAGDEERRRHSWQWGEPRAREKVEVASGGAWWCMDEAAGQHRCWNPP